MKNETEIKERILQLNDEVNLLLKKKRITKECSTAMDAVDNNLEKAYSQIRALEWVLKI